jgi:transposase-like protein
MPDTDPDELPDPETEAIASLNAALDAPSAEDLAAEDVPTTETEQRFVCPECGEELTFSHEVVE